MTGDGSDTTLTLSTAPVHENNVSVYFDGVYQSKSNYSISGTTLTFSTAPPSGVAVEAITATNTSITTATQLSDADGDTLIQTEESSDEDKIRFDTGGSERMIIDSSGNVGIGTTSPTSTSNVTTLEVSNATTSRILLDSTGTGGRKYGWYSSTDGQFAVYDYDASAERLRINSSGNVGLGTTSPSSPNSVDRFLHIHDADHSSLVLSDDQNTWEIVSNNTFTIRDGTDTRLNIDPSGNVGIGTTSPGSILTAAGQVTATAGAVSAPTYSFISDTNTGMSRPTSDTINFVCGGTERMRIDSEGHLLVNTTSAINTAHTFQTTHAGNNVAIFNNTVTSGNPYGIQLRYSGVGSGTGGMLIPITQIRQEVSY